MTRLHVVIYTPDAILAALMALGWDARVVAAHDCAFGVEATREGWRLEVISFGRGLSVGLAHDADDIRGISANTSGEGAWAVSLPWYTRTTTHQAAQLAQGIQHLCAITEALSAARSPRVEARVRVPLSLHPQAIEVRE